MILVTGATGLVGAHLCLSLVRQNQKIVALYRRDKKRVALKDFFKTHNATPLFDQIVWRKADLTNLPALTSAFEGIRKVYHCAASVSMAYHKQAELFQVNQQGTGYIAELCIEKKIEKLVYVSSIAALGSETLQGPIDERTPWNSAVEKTPYAYSKYGAELEVWRCGQEGVPIAIVNPGVILGQGMPNSPIDQLIGLLQKGIRFYPTGVTGLVTVEDVVAVMLSLMEGPMVNERFILVAENWTYQRLLQEIAKTKQLKAPIRSLPMWLLHIGWVLESVLSAIGMRKKFLSKALVKTLGDKREIYGNKIVRLTDFTYTPIAPYLSAQLSSN